MVKKVLSLFFALSMLLTAFVNSVYAEVSAKGYDSATAELTRGYGEARARLYVSSSSDLEAFWQVSRYSNHSVIFKVIDPAGHVVAQTVKGPGTAGRFLNDWTPSTGTYRITVDCYGSAKDCIAEGTLQERW
ncbi:hypothetical protein C1X05_12440 [Laceyella sacchari]|uniref:FlgD Ig-like domain-containing protein n=2 Tax=Laceyella TaxID=292635 RepID=A0AA46AEK9_9BACL|nr:MULTISPECIES: hypothetical protein [Laceyella]AUS09546.1 hypothetical protein C1X05_12440 [Laceyella sacchari]PRZ17224.1 hypothetical protein CLV36_101325 [Laceyella sediminis]SMP13473.1 hypothetical protein SAMN06265361_102460 [Laceyella tengchongensis]